MLGDKIAAHVASIFYFWKMHVTKTICCEEEKWDLYVLYYLYVINNLHFRTPTLKATIVLFGMDVNYLTVFVWEYM